MKSHPPRKPLFGDSTMAYAAIGIGASSHPYPSYAAAMRWRSSTLGGEADLKARALLARAARRAAIQEPI
jgi:hypothetical protein